MKIAFVYDAVYPWVKGGVEKRVWEIARRLARDHEVHIYGMKYWDGADIIEKEGVYIHGVCFPKELYVNGRRSIKEALFFAYKVFTPLVKESFDVIDCQEFPYFPCLTTKIQSILRGTSLVITWHEYWGKYWFEYLGWIGSLGIVVEKIVANLTKNNIAVSTLTANKLEKTSNTSVKVIPNGIDYNSIKNIIPKEKSDLIYAGRLIKEKNVDLIIKAVKELINYKQDLKFIIVGDGPEKENLRKLVSNLELVDNVIFKGFIESYDYVLSLIKGSKIFVSASTREGFGIVMLEANACGIPVVASNYFHNAGKELIEDGVNGCLFDNTYQDLSDKILQLLNNNLNLSKHCFLKAQKYDWDYITKKTEAYYMSTLRTDKSSAVHDYMDKGV